MRKRRAKPRFDTAFSLGIFSQPFRMIKQMSSKHTITHV